MENGKALDVDRLRRALDALPQLSRIVYLLHATDGLSYGDIAFRIGEDVRAVERHLAVALEVLARLLKPDDKG